MTTSTKDAFRRVENSVHRLSEEPRRKIECLVDELMTLHKKLLTDGDHIQLDIEGYAELNLHVMTPKIASLNISMNRPSCCCKSATVEGNRLCPTNYTHMGTR